MLESSDDKHHDEVNAKLSELEARVARLERYVKQLRENVSHS